MILEGNEINGKPIVFTGVSNALHALDNNHILAIAEEILEALNVQLIKYLFEIV